MIGSVFLLASILLALSLPLVLGLKLAVLWSIFLYGGWIFWRFILLKNKHSVIAIKQLAAKEWRIWTPHMQYKAQLCGSSTLTPVVMVLRFRIAEQYWPLSCVVFRDALPTERYKQLYMLLKR